MNRCGDFITQDVDIAGISAAMSDHENSKAVLQSNSFSAANSPVRTLSALELELKDFCAPAEARQTKEWKCLTECVKESQIWNDSDFEDTDLESNLDERSEALEIQQFHPEPDFQQIYVSDALIKKALACYCTLYEA